LGDLGLDGPIAPVAGVLPAAIGANAKGDGLICPACAGRKPAWASPDIEIVAANSLIQLANHFKAPKFFRARSRRSSQPRDQRSTSPTSRARKAPSARSKWPPPAGTIC
jgi:magnesium chelatase family protein